MLVRGPYPSETPGMTSIKLWDISPPVHASSPIFPGDEPYALRWTARLSPDCPVNLSAVSTSPMWAPTPTHPFITPTALPPSTPCPWMPTSARAA